MGKSKKELVRELLTQRWQPDAEYFAISFDVTDSGTIVWGAQTSWAGFSSGTPKYEMRKACFVIPERMWAGWREMGEPGMTINSLEKFKLFVLWGGNALIRRDIAEQEIPDILAKRPAVQRAGEAGWLDPATIPDHELQHAPTPKKRMEVLKRDGKRCMICGRRPAEDVHVRLEVHHIRIWGLGGLTETDNLITLCSTCHGGLVPHNDHSLFELIGIDPFNVPTRGQEHYKARLIRYQATVLEFLRRQPKQVRRGKA